jgi:hypothetical protein
MFILLSFFYLVEGKNYAGKEKKMREAGRKNDRCSTQLDNLSH